MSRKCYNCAIIFARSGDARARINVPSWSRGKLPLSGGLGRSVFCLGVAVLHFSFFSPHRPHTYSTWSCRYRYRSSEQGSRDSYAMELWDEEQGDWTSTPVDYGELLNGKKDAYESTAVIHPFGHRQFRAMAQKLVIPPMVLDLMLKGKDRDYSSTRRPRSTWKPVSAPSRPIESSRDRERAANRYRSRLPASRSRSRAKDETTWIGKMGGVRGHTSTSPPPMRPSRGFSAAIGRGVGGVRVGGATSSMKPKISGRGHALSLRMRAERGGVPLRKPGRLVSP